MITPAKAADHTIELNGLQFHYREWGDAGAMPLVLLHGFTGHARTWDTFAAEMCDAYRVLALDQRGHGETAWAKDYAPERRVEDLEAFVQALRLGKFALLGLSMGGICAYDYAAKHPETLDKLVIVDIAPELDGAGRERIQAGVAAPDVFDDPEEAVAQARLGNPRAPEDALRHRVLNNLMRRDDGKWTFRYDAALRGGRPIRQADPEPAWAKLRKITCPALLIRGAESDLLGRAAAERMTREIPNCHMVEVPRSGHSVPLDNPPGFLAAVRTFL